MRSCPMGACASSASLSYHSLHNVPTRMVQNHHGRPQRPVRRVVSSSSTPKASLDSLRHAAMELPLLAKHNSDYRIRIAASGAELGVTALLNLSICDENKAIMVEAGAIRPLVRALKSVASPAARESAACALLRLSQLDSAAAAAVDHAGAILLLVSLLKTGGARRKKDEAPRLRLLSGRWSWPLGAGMSMLAASFQRW
ncbi:U-box domain-containing protein 8-like [Aegilops tauschii subsp. strangulata]|uniref:U-box domain-containing protein 8-like n=1 Tax=Aegilops tauschii subsp. strangulata TaxID=200361 RepID=UPI003CC87358